MAPSPAPHDRPSFGLESAPPTSSSPTAQRSAAAIPPPPPTASATQNAAAPPTRSDSASPRGTTAGSNAHKSSPPSASRNAGGPKIVVKKEPGSPDLPTTRHRPKKLDLSKDSNIVSPATGRPLTAREGLGIQEVGLACLSPGFVTQDPVMNANVQRSMNVREQQRQIIEARLQQQSAKGDGPNKDKDGSHFAAKTPGLARKRGAPPGLSIIAPPHEHFANERVIQSAPLGQTFTGMHNPHPLTRHITNQPSKLSNTSHIHHVPATQTNNRLPPIADVFGQNLSGHPDSSGHGLYPGQNRGPLASPHHPPAPPHQAPAHQAPTPGRPREYKSAEEAQVELAGGRPELLPKLVRYGGHHQPPTPPSPPHHGGGGGGGGGGFPRDHHRDHRPLADHAATATSRSASSSNNNNSNHLNHHHHPHHQTNNTQPPPPPSSSSSMKRRRHEYEEGGSPPLGNGRPAGVRRTMMFGEGVLGGRDSRDSPDSAHEANKRETFIRLCGELWDLLRS
ncbi:hypothetical protein N656DRAFT_703757 [Canariomyces notabilis]|uniref:Uncharacterized protein n=1 Tax=Canariomyces notabilis TaxID=2074819 RepID=A0AAN6TIG3_9PEZI|nr:hypothetical protein N656DRAFT_703757 [Canariomyces arenarius]